MSFFVAVVLIINQYACVDAQSPSICVRRHQQFQDNLVEALSRTSSARTAEPGGVSVVTYDMARANNETIIIGSIIQVCVNVGAPSKVLQGVNEKMQCTEKLTVGNRGTLSTSITLDTNDILAYMFGKTMDPPYLVNTVLGGTGKYLGARGIIQGYLDGLRTFDGTVFC